LRSHATTRRLRRLRRAIDEQRGTWDFFVTLDRTALPLPQLTQTHHCGRVDCGLPFRPTTRISTALLRNALCAELEHDRTRVLATSRLAPASSRSRAGWRSLGRELSRGRDWRLGDRLLLRGVAEALGPRFLSPLALARERIRASGPGRPRRRRLRCVRSNSGVSFVPPQTSPSSGASSSLASSARRSVLVPSVGLVRPVPTGLPLTQAKGRLGGVSALADAAVPQRERRPRRCGLPDPQARAAVSRPATT
jgi:hypothetical protein